MDRSMPLIISSAAHADILQAAQQCFPLEACGLLLGRDDRVDCAVAVANVHPDPARHFEIDPAALVAAHRAARSGGPDVIGYFHSHPNGRAGLSEIDRRNAARDGRVWLIVADQGITAWKDGATGFEALSYAVR